MKALSIHPIWAGAIFAKEKTVECRTWKTDYRGDLLICSTNKKHHDTIPGHALCVVELKDIVPFEKRHLEPAMMHPDDYQTGMYAWILDNVRPIRPIPVKGKLSLWTFDEDDRIEYLPEPKTEEEDRKMFEKLYKPIMI